MNSAIKKTTIAALLLAHSHAPVHAQDVKVPMPEAERQWEADVIVTYDAEFFRRYQPNSALDMVRRLPGFQIDDGADKRGLAAAAGNVLINDRYPSAKQDTPSNLLERLPASQVERIDIVRGQVRDIDLRGQPVVASVILRDDIPGATRWEVTTRKNLNHNPVTVQGSISHSDRFKSLEYNGGLVFRDFSSQEIGTERTYDAAGVLNESRLEETFLSGNEGNANLNLVTWIGDTVISINSQFGFDDRNETLDSVRAPDAPGGQDDDFLVDNSKQTQFEFGADAERNLQTDLFARVSVLYAKKDDDFRVDQNRIDANGNPALYRVADGMVVESEAIARLELNWAGWGEHSIRFNFELARNVIDSELVQTADDGSGPVEVPVPGANTRVEEDRIDALLDDTLYGDVYEFNYGVGAESSTIGQTGDATNNRSFFFLKPQVSFSHKPTNKRMLSLRLAREVSQLDFSDFVSSTIFEDDDVALGNPDLKPESTWVAELISEHRLSKLGVVRFTLFHHWISDVEDLLPLTPEFEVPGNIGDGRRWGLKLESTLPLDWMGLREARLDIEARLQDSQVQDPVTGESRMLSGDGDFGKPLPLNDESHYAYSINFRQDFESSRFAWGWEFRRRATRLQFKVNELVEYEDGLEANLFVETTRWLGLKVRVAAQNLTDFNQIRNRTIYVGERGITPVNAVELRNRTDGRRLLLTVSGAF